jgi:hypothetical protein
MESRAYGSVREMRNNAHPCRVVSLGLLAVVWSAMRSGDDVNIVDSTAVAAVQRQIDDPGEGGQPRQEQQEQRDADEPVDRLSNLSAEAPMAASARHATIEQTCWVNELANHGARFRRGSDYMSSGH